MAEKVSCPYCDKAVTVDLTGCPHCGAPLNPHQLKASLKPKEKIPSKEMGERCSGCGMVVRKGDIICTQCGTNLLTGQQVILEEQHRAKMVKTGSLKPYLVGGVLIVCVLLVGGLIWWLNQDPVAKAAKLAQENEPLRAEQVLDKYLLDFPDAVEAHLLLGKLYLLPEMRQYDKAARSFEEAYTIDPSKIDTAYMAVMAAAHMPGPEFRTMEIALLEALVADHPAEARAFRMLGLVHGSAGNVKKQVAALEQALTLQDEPATHIALALAKLQQNDPAAARTHLDKGLTGKAAPMIQAAAQGIVSAMEGESGAAAQHFQQAIASDDSLPSAHALLAASALEANDPQKARALLQKARSQSPLSPAAHFLYALSLQATDAPREALSEFDRLVARKGPFSEQSALQLAALQLSLGDDAKASSALRQAGTLGDSPQGHTLRGRIYALQGELNDAAKEVRDAISLDRSYAPARLENGLLYLMRGVEAEGIREIEAYLALISAETQDAHVNEIELLLEQFKLSQAGNLSAQANR